MRNFIFLSLITLIPLFSTAAEETVISKIFPLGGLQGKSLFVQTTQIERSNPDSFVSTAKIEDSNGKVLMTEKVVVKGAKLVFQAVEQLQTQEAWELEVQDQKATYRAYAIDGAEKRLLGKEKSEIVGSDFINGPMIEIFISKNWQDLQQGRAVTAEFSVLELQRPVTFKFSKERETQRDGKSVVVVKMKPANFVLSMLVDPIFMEFDRVGQKLIYFKGRTPLKADLNGKKIPLDAEILYSQK